MTQNEEILRHLLTYGKITSLEAMNKYRIMRLGARIYDLKSKAIRSRRIFGSGNLGAEKAWYLRNIGWSG